MAISIESLPPEMHTAMQSPGFTSSYCRTAFVKLHQIFSRKRFAKARLDARLDLVAILSRYLLARSHARYPPVRLYAS